ncbi:MAG: flagellar export protein FliJ [Chloroflexi bacterium]|nr:flagellar export protein FliJ [Chloroflexota bacterium]
MATPDFRLQSVLDYRQSLVDRSLMELAALQHRQAQEEQRLEALRTAERVACARLEMAHDDILDMPAIRQLNEHLTFLTTRIQQQQTVVQRLRGEVVQLQQALPDLAKDVKALEKLRERKLIEHARHERRLERIESGEIAADRFRRLRAAR